MVIGVLADTHDNMPAIEEAVSFFNENNVSLVLHAGDIISPFTARAFQKLNGKMIAIFGNNDGDKLYLKTLFSPFAEIYDDPYVGEIEGKKIAMTHKPEIVDALSLKYDIVIYGHTHENEIRKEDTIIINPGECCGYLTGKRSIVLFFPQKMDAQLIYI
ncbi:MAG: metallophosphoesterase [Thermoplasmata archaeon]|nr:MAG: metallophosphoesterase [Thermoplasmata archaeon]